MELMAPSKSAQKIYDEFCKIISGKKENLDIAKECALLAIKIVRSSNPQLSEEKIFINKKGEIVTTIVNSGDAQEFWRDVQWSLEDMHLN